MAAVKYQKSLSLSFAIKTKGYLLTHCSDTFPDSHCNGIRITPGMFTIEWSPTGLRQGESNCAKKNSRACVRRSEVFSPLDDDSYPKPSRSNLIIVTIFLRESVQDVNIVCINNFYFLRNIELPVIKLIVYVFAYDCKSTRQPATALNTGIRKKIVYQTNSLDSKIFWIQSYHFKFWIQNIRRNDKTYCADFCASLALLAG